MTSLPPNASPPFPPLSTLARDELVKIIERAESKIVDMERERSVDGGIWSWDGDAAGIKQGILGRSHRVWNKVISSLRRLFASPPLLLTPHPSTRQTPKLFSNHAEKRPISHLLPGLPIELVRAVASACDRKTLHSFCLSNHLFLEIASPLLYETFEVKNSTQLEVFVGAVSVVQFFSSLSREWNRN